MPKPQGALRIFAPQPGTVAEAIETLSAIENAYLVLYATELHIETLSEVNPKSRRVMNDYGFPIFTLGLGALGGFPPPLTSEAIRNSLLLPEHILQINAIQFQSAGFWEFLGSLNPLEQIRKYLKDRHERSKDRRFTVLCG